MWRTIFIQKKRTRFFREFESVTIFFMLELLAAFLRIKNLDRR